MIFKRQRLKDSYNNRLNLLDGVSCFKDLLYKCLLREPHTVLNTTWLVKTFKNSNISSDVISIGCDPIKEWAMIDNSIFNSITVYDIDADFVNYGNDFFKKNKINIKYLCGNVCDSDFRFDKSYKTLLLFQMDYIFSDKELNIILKKFINQGGGEVYVITPSLFNFEFTILNIMVFWHDILHVAMHFMKNVMIKIKNDDFDHFTYNRTSGHFLRLFKHNGLTETISKTYINENGSFNFYRFEKNDKHSCL